MHTAGLTLTTYIWSVKVRGPMWWSSVRRKSTVIWMDPHIHNHENEKLQQYKQPVPKCTHLVLPEMAQSPHQYQSLPQLKGVSPWSSPFWNNCDQHCAVSTVGTRVGTPGGRNSWGKKSWEKKICLCNRFGQQVQPIELRKLFWPNSQNNRDNQHDP